MNTITVNNIPDEIYRDLTEQAQKNHRSLDSEILFALQLYLMKKKEQSSPEELLERIRQFRATVKGSLSPEEIERSINEGRP